MSSKLDVVAILVAVAAAVVLALVLALIGRALHFSPNVVRIVTLSITLPLMVLIYRWRQRDRSPRTGA
jgi:hypothetical protein